MNVCVVNTSCLVKLNQYGISYNLTVDNNQAETGIYASVDGDVNLDILTESICIPEIAVPIIDFKTPATIRLLSRIVAMSFCAPRSCHSPLSS